MSREQAELAQLAKAERELAWQRLKRATPRIGDVLGAFPRRHPYLAMGAAAWLAMRLAGRRRRKYGGQGTPSSWLAALAAVAVRILPELARAAAAGRTVRAGQAPERAEAPPPR